MTIEKINNGVYKITDIVNGYLVTKKYFYYTKKECIKMFNQFIKYGINNNNNN